MYASPYVVALIPLRFASALIAFLLAFTLAGVMHRPAARFTLAESPPMLPTELAFKISGNQGHADPTYHLTTTADGPAARNTVHALQVRFNPLGMTIQSGKADWGLDLVGWGRGTMLVHPDANAVAMVQDNRLAYHHAGLMAWYVNGPDGVQQGWTVAAHPAGDGPLTLTLVEHGTLHGTVEPNAHSLSLKEEHLGSMLSYGGLLAFDATGRALAVHFMARDSKIQIVVDDRSAHYPVVIDPWVQVTKLTASDQAKGDILGRAIAVSGDGGTVVVGAPSNAAGGAYRGASYVYTRPPSGWATLSDFSAKLTASDGGDGDVLGIAVAISADGTTIVVGASNNAVGGKWRGAIYIYTKPPGGWATTNSFNAKLTATDEADDDNLGFTVAISADGTTIVAGAPYNAAGGDSRGAMYLYAKPAGGWTTTTQTAKLTASDGVDYDLLGSSVAASADGTTVAAGMKQIGSTYRGAAYVYTKPLSGWGTTSSFKAKLTAADAPDFDDIGDGVAISGDGATIVVGAPGNDTGGNSSGVVYVYSQPISGWVTTGSYKAKLVASDGADGDDLGESVAISIDGATIIAGSWSNAAGGTLRGAVYAYTKPSDGWTTTTETAKLTAADRLDGNSLGYAVAVNTDGTTIVAGALGNSAGGSGYGSAYVFGSGTPSNNADLRDFAINQGVLTPVFTPGTTDYSATVPNGISSITITPIVSDTMATVTINGHQATSGSAAGPFALSVGANNITTTVTAQDGTTVKTYTLTVTRQRASNADLRSLTLSQGTLTPVFTPGTTDYSATVPNGISSITITPTVSDTTATVTINGHQATSGSAAGPFALSVGQNSITTTITAQDDTTIKTYTITVIRAFPNIYLPLILKL